MVADNLLVAILVRRCFRDEKETIRVRLVSINVRIMENLQSSAVDKLIGTTIKEMMRIMINSQEEDRIDRITISRSHHRISPLETSADSLDTRLEAEVGILETKWLEGNISMAVRLRLSSVQAEGLRRRVGQIPWRLRGRTVTVGGQRRT